MAAHLSALPTLARGVRRKVGDTPVMYHCCGTTLVCTTTPGGRTKIRLAALLSEVGVKLVPKIAPKGAPGGLVVTVPNWFVTGATPVIELGAPGRGLIDTSSCTCTTPGVACTVARRRCFSSSVEAKPTILTTPCRTMKWIGTSRVPGVKTPRKAR